MGRYLKLDGTSPDIKSRALRHVFTAESFASGAFIVATTAAACHVTDLRGAFIAAACGVASSAAAQLFTRNFVKGTLTHYFGDLDRRHFDRAPDKTTMPTRPAHRLAAEHIAVRGTNTAIGLTAAALPYTLGLLFVASAFPGVATLAVATAALTGLLGLNMASNAGLIAWRFSRVARNQWKISDRPPGLCRKPSKPVLSILPLPQDPMPI